MSRPSILLVGAGGHAIACIDVIEAGGHFQITGLLGSPAEKGSLRLGYPVLGADEDMPLLVQPAMSALVCVGQIKSPDTRIRLFAKLLELGYSLPAIISPHARVSPHARLGAGSIVMHGAIINASADIGKNCIINTRSVIEHGAQIGNHCHVSTGALLNGDVQVGEGCFIGSGSRVKEGVRLGQRCLVGMGATVFSDLADGETLKLAG